MVGLAIVGGILAAALLAVIGKSQVEAASASSNAAPDNSPVTDSVGTAVPVNDSSDENIEASSVTEWRNSGITTDYGTWPSGDAIWDICRAIAKAEGYDTNGAAFRLNNPGDISDGAKLYGSQFHDGSNITKFPDAATGWNWLYSKVSNHIFGKSDVYPAEWTITQFAHKYAAKWQPWKTIVGKELSVDPDNTTFSQYVGV